MKELGEYLKNIRKENGVSIDEAADDLKITKQVLSNVESGNTRAFRDMLELKEIVKSYSKYLGLDSEKIIDEFNDFMFEHTSKIKLSDILEAESKIDEKSKKTISSPYTKPSKPQVNINVLKWVFCSLLLIVFVLIILMILKTILFPKDIVSSELMNYSKTEVKLYECA